MPREDVGTAGTYEKRALAAPSFLTLGSGLQAADSRRLTTYFFNHSTVSGTLGSCQSQYITRPKSSPITHGCTIPCITSRTNCASWPYRIFDACSLRLERSQKRMSTVETR